ncbi:MAG: menaquinone biosynthetic enzyme MqnA/MqnD family protein [Ferruginibacter sp.]
MIHKIKVGAVSYLNTKPLIYGFEQGKMNDAVELLIDYPSNIASLLMNDEIDVGLVPVAVIPQLKEHHIISDYCIGCDGEVASVCLFSEVPLNEIETIILDYQSRSSVALLKILLKEHWNISPKLVAGSGNFEKDIKGNIAGLVIGDRALVQRQFSSHIYDLGLAWKEMTGLPFVFAAWVSNKQLPDSFIAAFNEANAFGFMHLQEVLEQNPVDYFNLESYYNHFLKFKLDDRMKEANALFLRKLKN